MFIQTETTPNPATLRFVPGRPVMEAGTAHFVTVAEAARSPLAEQLFGVPGIQGVFLGTDFVTVTKADDRDWQVLKPAILGVIMEHFTAGKPVILADGAAADETFNEADTEIVDQIKERLGTPVPPAAAPDRRD